MIAVHVCYEYSVDSLQAEFIFHLAERFFQPIFSDARVEDQCPAAVGNEDAEVRPVVVLLEFVEVREDLAYVLNGSRLGDQVLFVGAVVPRPYPRT